MKFEAIASSSKGNAYVVTDGTTTILLECGISHRRLQQAAWFRLSQTAACFVSHEHKDHSKAVADIIKDGIQVYMSRGTAEALDLEAGIEVVEDREVVTIGTLQVMAFATFHDAREPLGFLIRSKVDGESLAFATDTVNLGYRFPGLTYLAIEANYDRDILERCDRMPEKVKKRIQLSHMEIHVLCDYLKQLDLRQCRKIYLLHLGDATSHEGHFINKVERVIPEGILVIACQKE